MAKKQDSHDCPWDPAEPPSSSTMLTDRELTSVAGGGKGYSDKVRWCGLKPDREAQTQAQMAFILS